MAIGIDKDCLTGRVYWSDITTKQIYSSKFDGTDKKSFITEGIWQLKRTPHFAVSFDNSFINLKIIIAGIVSPEGVAVDWISRRIYWTDSSKDTIEVASLDDATLRTVVIQGGLVNPRGIAVDPQQSKLYWSDWNRESPKIEQSDLDGTNRVVLLQAPQLNLPNSLSFSSRSGEVCYADAGTQQIGCISPYHRTVRTVATNLTYPFGLTVTNDRLYWTDWTTCVYTDYYLEPNHSKENRLYNLFFVFMITAKKLRAVMNMVTGSRGLQIHCLEIIKCME